ncbi:hypothetical protein MKK55_08850 [Methylobacterium sp. J-059]|uniref:hypothetical protein n=1 Tax=Methylobacterium sp. J-059 TaxID=2836643 RepID=UPI001FBA47D9|nr:hypothetical protein [Methylobacterium sp. J-059]MCJ2039058.1 hypothetical protein [Methylobacterium sp. J-059]
MSRFDFSEFVEQRDEAIRQREKAERDRQEQTRLTWVELKREVGNYVVRNGRRCEVTGEYPGLFLNAGSGLGFVVTVKGRSSFEVTHPGIKNAGYLETHDKTQEITSDRGLIQAIVDWYEALPRTVT